MKVNFKEREGITLVALVITIIIIIILAAISIQGLTNTGLFGRTNETKIKTQMSEIEEFATMKIYELYIENANNMEVINDATIKTALKEELQAKGYEIKDVNTTLEIVNGLKIQDSTGQNNFESISLLQQKNTTIKVDLDITSQSKTYVKIYDNLYELIINDKTVKVSREKYEGPVDSENTYEIKLTPPTTGITMTAGETPITSETAITPGALITIKAGNDIGTFAFTVKETTSSVTKNIDVEVTADTTYATDLSIAVEAGENAEIFPGGTLQLVATKTPTTSTDTVKWNIKSGSATIDTAGLVTADKNATIGSKIIVTATCNREDGTTTTVELKTLEIIVQKKIITLTAQQIVANPKLYYGKEVLNYKASDSDTNTYRIFYVDTTGYFGDAQYTIYLKADDSYAYNNETYTLNTTYNKDTKVKKMNPLWAAQRGTATWNDNEKAVAYLCSPVTSSTSTLPWKKYYNSANANYVIGGPSIEMYVKSYNQVEAYKNTTVAATKYKLGAKYKETDYPGYSYTINGTQSTITNGDYNTGVNSLDYSSTYYNMYCGKIDTTTGVSSKLGLWWLASPSGYLSMNVCTVNGEEARLNSNSYKGSFGISPLICLKTTFQPQIEE